VAIALAVAILVALAAGALAAVRQRQLGQARAGLVEARTALDGARTAAEEADARAEAAERRSGELARERAQLEQVRGELEQSVRELDEASTTRGSALEASRARARELDAALQEATGTAAAHAAALDAAVAELAELERRLDERTRGPVALGEAEAAACWQLLLARVERQWAAGVAAHPGERGLAPDPGERLAEAIARELERLREEVGVHAEAVVTGHFGADPLATLLATGEALAVLAPHAERVRVELGDQVVVVGEDWSGPPAELDALEAAVAGTGLLGGVAVSGGRVELVLVTPATGPAAG
jgi:hypothetical protein